MNSFNRENIHLIPVTSAAPLSRRIRSTPLHVFDPEAVRLSASTWSRSIVRFSGSQKRSTLPRLIRSPSPPRDTRHSSRDARHIAVGHTELAGPGPIATVSHGANPNRTVSSQRGVTQIWRAYSRISVRADGRRRAKNFIQSGPPPRLVLRATFVRTRNVVQRH